MLAIYEKADIPKDVLNAFVWQSRRSAEEVMRFREHVMQTLEHASEEMWSNGLCSQWLAGVDPGVAKVSATVAVAAANFTVASTAAGNNFAP